MKHFWPGLPTPLFTILALACFAANALLCRAALGNLQIDAVSFTSIRIASGAAALFFITKTLNRGGRPAGDIRSSGALYIYAILFSIAYTRLGAAVGTLVLFGAVQFTIYGWSIYSGSRPRAMEWAGVLLAFGGLVYLIFPGLGRPDPVGAALMAAAGAAWGIYTIQGRSSTRPVLDTAGNLIKAVPFAAAAQLLTFFDLPGFGHPRVRPIGALLAAVSGILTTGIGYCFWYAAVPKLSRTQAGLLQSTVPIIAAFGAVLFLGEEVTTRLAAATAAILLGIGLAHFFRGAK